MRYVVVGMMVWLNWRLLKDGTSSENVAMAYAAGMVASWGTMWGGALVLGLGRGDVQRDFARVERRKRKARREGGTNGGVNGSASGRAAADRGSGDVDEEVRKRRRAEVPDESVALVVDEYEHYWQPFPEDAPFKERFYWVWDLYLAFRGIGKSLLLPSLFHPP